MFCNCLRMKNPFRYFKTSPEIIRLAVMMYVRFPLSLRHVEDLLHERGIEVSHETIRATSLASSSGISRTLRCVDRGCLNTRQARRSETRSFPSLSLT